jgi:hypothetical protein
VLAHPFFGTGPTRDAWRKSKAQRFPRFGGNLESDFERNIQKKV